MPLGDLHLMTHTGGRTIQMNRSMTCYCPVFKVKLGNSFREQLCFTSRQLLNGSDKTISKKQVSVAVTGCNKPVRSFHCMSSLSVSTSLSLLCPRSRTTVLQKARPPDALRAGLQSSRRLSPLVPLEQDYSPPEG